MNWQDLAQIDFSQNIILMLLINLTVVVLLILSLRFLWALVANVRSTEELSKKDNYAFGISMAGGIFALGLVLNGVLATPFRQTISEQLLLLLGYGMLGMVLIRVGRFLQDKLVFPNIKLHQEISQNNLAAAIIDASNIIATAIIVRAAMLWVDAQSWQGVFAVLSSFIVAQVILGLIARFRFTVFARRNNGKHLELAFEEGNEALALRFGGHVIGVGLAVTTSSYFVSFLVENMFVSLIGWALCAVALTILLSFLAFIAKMVVLAGIDIVEEVDHQRNIGVAAIEGVIYLTIGLVFVALMG